MSVPAFQSFDEFFPYYLAEHADPRNRALHYIGTTLVIAVAVAALSSGNGWLALLMPVAGYAFAWVGHFLIEKNRPATFSYPLWSLRGDFAMYFLFLTGGLGSRLADARDRYPTAAWRA